MPLEGGQFGGGVATPEDRKIASSFARLKRQYADPMDYDAAARANEGLLMNTVAGLGDGLEKGVSNMLNLIPDMVGYTKPNGERLFDIDLVDRRENNTYFDVVSGITQFVSGLPIGGPMAKGATKLTGYGMKALRGTDHVKKAQRARQVGKSGRDFKTGKRMTVAQTLKQESLNGLLRGYMADFAAFNGDESMLLGFFKSHPELHNAYQNISSQEGWEERTSEDLARESILSFEKAMTNIGGRGIMATEGALLGGFFNVFWQSMKLMATRTKLIQKGAFGMSEKAKKGAEKTEAKAGEEAKQSLKEEQENLGFEHKPQRNLNETLNEKELKKARQEEADLARKQSELEEQIDNTKGKDDDLLNRPEDETVVPHEWDKVPQERNKLGILKTVFLKGAVHHSKEYNPAIRQLAAGEKGPMVESVVRGVDDADIRVNRNAILKEWEGVTKGKPKELLASSTTGTTVPRAAFNSASEYEAWLIARKRAEIKFPKTRNEKLYQQRLDIHAANALKRRGIGSLWKYEFDAPAGMKHLEVDPKLIHERLFSGGDDAARGFVKSLQQAALGKGKNLNEMLLEAQELINVDGTMTDAGSKYFTGRLMHFMSGHLKKSMAVSKDDQIAKAIGWLSDDHGMSAKDVLMQDVINQIDNIATANNMDSLMVMERFRKGYGDWKGSWDELKVGHTDLEKALLEDTKVMKELYVRTWAYRIDQMVSMKQFMKLTEKITDATPTSDKAFAEFAAELKRIEAKLSSFQRLSTASGRQLAAHKSMQSLDMFGGDPKVMLNEIINRAGGKRGLTKLANRLEAIMSAAKKAGSEQAGEEAAIGIKNLTHKSITGIDLHNEYWLNSILSGTKTQVVNTIGTALHMAYKPAEGFIGAIGDRKSRRFFIHQTMYAANIMGETIKLLAALGLNKGARMTRWSTEAAYNEGRKEIFGRGTQGAGALAGGRKAFRSGKSVLESRSALFDVTPTKAITGDFIPDGIADAAFLGQPVGRWAKGMLDWAGEMIRLPSRFMISTDELYKQISYRSSAMARLTGDAIEELGEGASHKALAEHAATRFHGMIRKTGARYTPDVLQDEAWNNYAAAIAHANSSGEKLPPEFSNRDDYIYNFVDKHYDANRSTLSDFAMDWAEDVTFTRPLDTDFKRMLSHNKVNPDDKSWQQDIQDLVGRHSWMRILMPFIRTPVNLLKFPLQRIPLAPSDALIQKRGGMLKKFHMRYQADMLSKDPIRAAEALGRVRTGAMLYSSLISLAAMGTVTGKGPTNARERKLKMETGWRPYSFEIGEYYVSYARLDPFSTILGLSADMAEFLDEASEGGDINDNWINALFMSGMYATSNNILNKSYLAGLTNILQGLMNPVGGGNYAERLLTKQATSYIPKAISQFTVVTDDPFIKETRDLMTAMKAKIPGLASGVEARRGILGDKLLGTQEDMFNRMVSMVNPFSYSKIKDDEVLDTLASLQFGFTPPEAQYHGKESLDMRKFVDDKGQSAYDFFQEAIGTTRLGGENVRERMMRFIKSRQFREWTKAAQYEDWERGTNDPRVKGMKRLLQQFRGKAKAGAEKAFPELDLMLSHYRNKRNKQLRHPSSLR
jgi:hypothetical protein